MTLSTRTTADASKLLTRFGEEIIRIPEGRGKPESVTAIVDRRQETRDDQRGQGYRSEVEFDVAADQAVSRVDRWKIDGRTYFTHLLNEPECGLRTLVVIDREKKRTTSEGRV